MVNIRHIKFLIYVRVVVLVVAGVDAVMFVAGMDAGRDGCGDGCGRDDRGDGSGRGVLVVGAVPIKSQMYK